jgi:hypothetical protein
VSNTTTNQMHTTTASHVQVQGVPYPFNAQFQNTNVPGVQFNGLPFTNTNTVYTTTQQSLQYGDNGQTVPSHYSSQARGILPVLPPAIPYNYVPNGPGTREKEPDKFDGKSVEWCDYIIHFESVATWNRWNNAQKAQQLIMSLRGSAQKLLSDIRPDMLTNYEEIKGLLTRRFNPVERETAYRCEFRNRRQKRQESASDFGYALHRLCLQAFPGVGQEAREIYVIDQFINGLSRPEIRSHVQFRHPQTINAAIALAVEFEAFEGAQGILKKPRFEEDSQINLISDKVPKQPSSHTSRTDSITLSDIAKLIENLSLAVKRNNSRSNSRGRQESRERSKHTNFECFSCHGKGHIATNCPNLKSGN